ncbi:hypothetical protein DRH29_05465, partial [candidate division Kazan bacterium]
AIATIGGTIAALKLREPWDAVAAIYAGHHSTKFWDYLEEAVTTAAARIKARAGRSVRTTSIQMPSTPAPSPAPAPAPAPTPVSGAVGGKVL